MWGIRVQQKVKNWSDDLNNPKSEKFKAELSRLFKGNDSSVPLKMPIFVKQTDDVRVLAPELTYGRPVSSWRKRIFQSLSVSLGFITGLMSVWRRDAYSVE
jgi:hypothetical protein